MSFACKAVPAAIAMLVLSLHANAQTAPSADQARPADSEKRATGAKTAAKPAAKADAKADAKTDAALAADATPQTPPLQVVNVLGERSTNRVDRQVYDIKSDATTAGASIGDVLNNVPAVNVDPNGTVRLRGSERVTVLVDGKPTAQMQGENRAAAINSLPAENYESVQVINNPGAEFGNEAGGGPILNLISRRYTKPGGNGSVASNVGPNGRYNAFANGSYSAGYASVNGTLNVRRDGNESDTEQLRERIDPLTGAVSRVHQHVGRTGLNTFVQLGVGGRYNYNARDTLTGAVTLSKRGNDSNQNEQFTDYRTGLTPVIDYRTRRDTDGDALNREFVAGYEHRFATDGETLKFDLRHSSNTNTSASTVLYQPVTMPATGAPTLRDYRQDPDTRITITDLSTDYTGTIGAGAVTAGGRWQRTGQTFDNRYTFLSGAVPDPKRSNLFELDQDVLAVYSTFEMPINKVWSFKTGLRVERTDLDLNQVTTAITASNTYTNYLPSLFLSYKLDPNSTIRLSFADRISRPSAGDLNPFINYANEYYVSSGNPRLHPVKLHSLELGYETRVMGLMPVSLRGYLRRESDVITERRVFLSDTTLLTTRENLGDRRAGGLEFSVMAGIPPNIKFGGFTLPSIRFMFNGNWAVTEQDELSALGLTGQKRRATSLQLQGGGQWQITPTDVLTVMGFHQGKLLSGEGYRDPFGMMTMTYEHKFTPRLSLNLRANDVLRTSDIKNRVETPTLRDSTDINMHQRRLYVGLRYTFGGVTGNDAVRNALQSAGVSLDSQAARDAMRMMQGQPAAQGTPGQGAPAQKSPDGVSTGGPATVPAPAPASAPASAPPAPASPAQPPAATPL